MTVPNERTRAVLYAREFLLALLDPKKTPRVPKAVRKRAHLVLRHFPGELDMKIAGEKAPNTFGRPDEYP